MELEKIKYHINPENLFPQKTRLKWVKKLILRLIRVYTSAQIAFNTYTYEFLKNISEYLQLITSYLESLDSKETQIENSLQSLERKTYNPLFWQEHEDSFYVFQQKKFRGDFNTIKENQRTYLKYIQNLPQELKEKYAFLDIGFGRGEFLELLKEIHLPKILGVDINSYYVKEAKKKGFQVYQDDAISFLYNTKQKFSGISAFHLVEHLTFPQLFDFLYLIHQKLATGGILILETPNVENLTVSANSFFYDHTHKIKLPPLFLKSLLEYLKFKNIQIIYSSPIRENLTNDLEKAVFGPQDYAIIAYK